MGAKKSKKSSVKGKVTKAGKKILGTSGSKGKGRKKGPAYWQNKVLVEKLKKKFNRLKYGGR